MKFNILIECLEPECSVINFHWRPALHYHVSPPNYICINDVRHYYRGLGRHWRGERGSCAVWGGKGVLKGHWHRWCAFLFFFSSSCDDPQKCWGNTSLQCGESESGRFPSKWGFQEGSEHRQYQVSEPEQPPTWMTERQQLTADRGELIEANYQSVTYCLRSMKNKFISFW